MTILSAGPMDLEAGWENYADGTTPANDPSNFTYRVYAGTPDAYMSNVELYWDYVQGAQRANQFRLNITQGSAVFAYRVSAVGTAGTQKHRVDIKQFQKDIAVTITISAEFVAKSGIVGKAPVAGWSFTPNSSTGSSPSATLVGSFVGATIVGEGSLISAAYLGGVVPDINLPTDLFRTLTDTLDDITNGTTYGRVLLTSISAGKIILAQCDNTGYDLDDVSNGATYGRILLTDISAGHILLASCSGDLDDIANGTNYGKVALTDISAGHILLTATQENTITSISRPVGASLASEGNPATGAIVITLPQSWTNTMMRFVVDVYLYDYSNNKSFSLAVGGYNYDGSGGSWVSCTAKLTGNSSADQRVRFGHNGTKCCIVIGETTSQWSYPKIVVRDFQAGYTNYDISTWATGWGISILSSLSGYTFTVDFSDSLIDSKQTVSLANHDLDDLDDGATYGRVLLTDISAGHILLASCSGDLDDIDDGTSKVGYTPAEQSKLTGIAAGATVGADWTTNLSGIPGTLQTPSANGLYLSSTYLGFYTGGVWTSYIDNAGNFYFKGDANSFIDWNITAAGTLTIKGKVVAGTGSSISTSYFSGIVAQANLNVADRGWSQTCAFSAYNADAVIWGSGTFKSADGTEYSIGNGSTNAMGGKNYIYLDIAVSTTAYQTTTTAANAVGVGKVLIAIAQNGTNEATFMVMNGQGAKNIDASEIVAGSITANEIATGTITAAKIAASTITANEIAASTITGGKIAATTITATNLNISELSAIAANVGTLTSGTINGVTVKVSKLYSPTYKCLVDLSADGIVYLDTDTDVGGALKIQNSSGNVILNAISTDHGSETELILKGANHVYSRIGDTNYLDVSITGISVQGIVNASTSLKVNNTKVVGAQQAAIADPTDGPSAITALCYLLAACRTHGLIASS